MMRSLYSGISGLRNHQTRMDVIGNNIANVNTAGYKTSRVIFQDIFSQNVTAGMANTENMGGTNPMQIGLGIRLSTVDVLHTRSAFSRTDNPTDMMINGDGFFILGEARLEPDGTPIPGEYDMLFTRAGNFLIDDSGYLVSSHGFFVLGYSAPTVWGMITPPCEDWVPVEYIVDPNNANRVIPDPDQNPQAGGTGPVWGWMVQQRPVRDILGNIVTGADDLPVMEDIPATFGKIFIGSKEGMLNPDLNNTDWLAVMQTERPGFENPFVRPTSPMDPADPLHDRKEWADFFAATGLSRAALEQHDAGEDVRLLNFAAAPNGMISVLANNRQLDIAQLQIAMFSNPPGLMKAGNSLFSETASSGPMERRNPLEDGAGRIDAGGLEMSNVDLATEFTDMIVTQRGFQANSRIITVSDTMLEELVNLKR